MNYASDKARGVAEAQAARQELYGTLGQLSEQLNYAKRIDRAAERLQGRVREVRDERPLAFAAGVVTVAVGAGALVWVIARTVVRGIK